MKRKIEVPRGARMVSEGRRAPVRRPPVKAARTSYRILDALAAAALALCVIAAAWGMAAAYQAGLQEGAEGVAAHAER